MRKPFALACTLALAFTLACDDGGDDDGGDGGTGGDDRVANILSLNGDAAAGQANYDLRCGIETCHGADGTASGPNTTSPSLLDQTDMAMANAAINGVEVNGMVTMVPVSDLSDQELADVIAYIGTL